jgi:Na+/melibiose symporter-like transporter
LALIPELTSCESEQVSLNAIRYAFTVISNLFVYGVTFLLLKFNTSDSSGDPSNDLGPQDAQKFTYLTFIICGVGIIFQIIFHVGTKENNLSGNTELIESQANHVPTNWRGFLKTYKFYTVNK